MANCGDARLYSKTALNGASQVTLVVKNPPPSAGDRRHGSHPWVGANPWKRVWQSTQVFLLENPMGRGAHPWATVHRVAESGVAEATSHTCIALEKIRLPAVQCLGMTVLRKIPEAPPQPPLHQQACWKILSQEVVSASLDFFFSIHVLQRDL